LLKSPSSEAQRSTPTFDYPKQKAGVYQPIFLLRTVQHQ
jgi:hypothetical protein